MEKKGKTANGKRGRMVHSNKKPTIANQVVMGNWPLIIGH
jgi:hypothetical protein